MRRTLILLSLLTVSIVCFGCGSADNDNAAGNSSNASTKTTTANVNNSNGASSGNTALSDSDKHFVTDAAQGGMAEVELGRLAAKQGVSAAVKEFGQKMVDDHTKANNELKQLASSKAITLPTDMDAESKATMDRLSKLKGEEFDRAYMDDMVKDHTKDVGDFQREADSGADKDVKAFASKTLPTLQEHLRMAQAAAPREKQQESGKKK